MLWWGQQLQDDETAASLEAGAWASFFWVGYWLGLGFQRLVCWGLFLENHGFPMFFLRILSNRIELVDHSSKPSILPYFAFPSKDWAHGLSHAPRFVVGGLPTNQPTNQPTFKSLLRKRTNSYTSPPNKEETRMTSSIPKGVWLLSGARAKDQTIRAVRTLDTSQWETPGKLTQKTQKIFYWLLQVLTCCFLRQMKTSGEIKWRNNFSGRLFELLSFSSLGTLVCQL